MTDQPKKPRGFAAMSPERRTEIAKRGGAAPKERAFTRDRELAARAGRLGGLASGKARKSEKAEA